MKKWAVILMSSLLLAACSEEEQTLDAREQILAEAKEGLNEYKERVEQAVEDTKKEFPLNFVPANSSGINISEDDLTKATSEVKYTVTQYATSEGYYMEATGLQTPPEGQIWVIVETELENIGKIEGVVKDSFTLLQSDSGYKFNHDNIITYNIIQANGIRKHLGGDWKSNLEPLEKYTHYFGFSVNKELFEKEGFSLLINNGMQPDENTIALKVK